MNNGIVIYPPNKPFDRRIVRGLEDLECLFSLNFNRVGQALVSSSDVYGIEWYGAVYTFSNPQDLLNFKYSGYYMCSTTISDAVYFKNDYILVAEDNKTLKFLRLDEDVMSLLDSYNSHDIVEQVAVWDGWKKLVCGSGKSVITMTIENNLSDMVLGKDYRNFHSETVTSVDTHNTNAYMFASASLDKKACLWDDRIDTVAKVIYENEFSSLRSIAWNTTNSNELAVGTSAGDIYLIDIREPKEFLSVLNCSKYAIHRLKCNNSGQIAVCSDTNKVDILSTENGALKPLYSEEKHSNVVRGLAWHEKTLYSCGFNKEIFAHSM